MAIANAQNVPQSATEAAVLKDPAKLQKFRGEYVVRIRVPVTVEADDIKQAQDRAAYAAGMDVAVNIANKHASIEASLDVYPVDDNGMRL